MKKAFAGFMTDANNGALPLKLSNIWTLIKDETEFCLKTIRDPQKRCKLYVFRHSNSEDREGELTRQNKKQGIGSNRQNTLAILSKP